MLELWERNYRIQDPVKEKKVKVKRVEQVEQPLWKKYEYRDWRKILL